jgi:hypothetical protein
MMPADRAGCFCTNKDLLKFALLCGGQTVTQGNVFLCQILTYAKRMVCVFKRQCNKPWVESA